LRDTRIRAHYGERYDHRRNLVDWDYSMSLKDFAPLVHQKEYREWRLNGVGFETRLATGTIPNRTLASDVNGKTKKGRDSCKVRGFWGDIINSPFLAYGMEVSDPTTRMRFFKKVNYQ
jgi:dynein assembly factor 3